MIPTCFQPFVLDTEFHLAILNVAGNKTLSHRYTDVCQKIFLRFRTEELRIERIEQICLEHDNLFEAVSLKDTDRAKEIIQMHHETSRAALFPIIFGEKN